MISGSRKEFLGQAGHSKDTSIVKCKERGQHSTFARLQTNMNQFESVLISRSNASASNHFPALEKVKCIKNQILWRASSHAMPGKTQQCHVEGPLARPVTPPDTECASSFSVNPFDLETSSYVPSQSILNRIPSLNNWSEYVRMVEADSTVVQNAAVPDCTMLHLRINFNKSWTSSTRPARPQRTHFLSTWNCSVLEQKNTLWDQQNPTKQSLTPKPQKCWNRLFPHASTAVRVDLGSKLHAPSAAVRSFTPYCLKLEKRTTCVKNMIQQGWIDLTISTSHFYSIWTGLQNCWW